MKWSVYVREDWPRRDNCTQYHTAADVQNKIKQDVSVCGTSSTDWRHQHGKRQS